MTTPDKDSPVSVQEGGTISLATGKGRTETAWKNKTVTWSKLVEKLSHSARLAQTHAEFLALPKAKQDDLKDIGGFVGGTLKGGHRRSESVAWRSMVTLDADFARKAFVERVLEVLAGKEFVVYSTAKHCLDKPRMRVVMPLARPVSADEYLPIARKVAQWIGIEDFDPTGYEPERLFYWPLACADVEPVFAHGEGVWLDPQAVLAEYEDWKDPFLWPQAERESGTLKKLAKRQGDPLAKPGMIGAFNRAFPVSAAIENFLLDVYEPLASGARYTLVGGTTTGGLVIYENDTFAYSHHGTDKASQRLCSAFDLVRLHKYAELDEDCTEDTPVNKLPSYAAMREFANSIPEVRAEAVAAIAQDVVAEAISEFGEVEVDSETGEITQKTIDWRTELTLTDNGDVEPTIGNFVTILTKSGKFDLSYNAFADRLESLGDLPWRKKAKDTQFGDFDFACLAAYCERSFGLRPNDNIQKKALAVLCNQVSHHPVRDYLDGLEWDGVSRIDTLLHVCFGTFRTPYSEMVIRKFMVAAVARVFAPGCKWDHMPILKGVEGLRKSSFFEALCAERSWFADDPPPIKGGKDIQEWMRGKWIVEFAELSSFSGREVEHIKSFVTTQVDRYRAAYGTYAVDHPRQCVFAGTTNDETPLKSSTGNRRMWPVECRKRANVEYVKEHRDQLWAEACALYLSGEESLWVDDERLEAAARQVQDDNLDDSGWAGLIEEWLNEPIPEGYYDTPRGQEAFLTDRKMVLRTSVSAHEVLIELFGFNEKEIHAGKAKQVAAALRKIGGWTTETVKTRTGKRYGRQRLHFRLNSDPVKHSGENDGFPF